MVAAMNISQGIVEGARIYPEQCALWFEEKEWTYAELEDQSAAAAKILLERGVCDGDRVALILGNVPAFPVWYYGILRIGAVAVSVNTRLSGEEAAYIVSDCGAKVAIQPAAKSPLAQDGVEVIGVEENGELAGEEKLIGRGDLAFGQMVEKHPDDPGIILYTSGTTGFPKGAVLSHQNVRSTVHAFNHLCGMTPQDRLLLMVPLFHCYGQNALLNAGSNAAATIVLQRVFDLAETKRLIKEQSVSKLFGVPTTFQLMLEACQREDLASVKYCFSAAATLAPQLGEAWQKKFGLPIYEGYGLTETAPFASYNHRLEHVPGSIGAPVDLVEMKVVDPDTGEDCPPNTPGEIVVRGPNVMLGYWNKPEETGQAIREGWFYSGDVGTADENGYFYIVDRIKDMIAIGGLKVYPSEVERVLLDAPGVADCAVVGLAEKTLGEEVAAFVVPKSENSAPDSDALRSYLLERLASFKVPTRFVTVDSLPRNPAGKVLKTELRSYGEGTGVGESNAANAPGKYLEELTSAHPSSRDRKLTEHIQETIRKLTSAAESPGTDAPLLETGMDSLMMVQFVSKLKEDLGAQLELPATLLFDYPRIRDLSGYILTELELAESGKTAAPQNLDEPPVESTGKPIEEMSEEEAERALQRELQGGSNGNPGK